MVFLTIFLNHESDEIGECLSRKIQSSVQSFTQFEGVHSFLIICLLSLGNLLPVHQPILEGRHPRARGRPEERWI